MSDDPRRWQRIKDLVAEALELPVAARADFLAGRCGGDEDLHRDAAALVAAGAPDDVDTPRGILDDSALVAAGMAAAGASADPSGDELVGRRLGPYLVLRRIGQGGMGVVLEAEQESPARRVALKVLQGRWASEQLRARFDLEIETLGRLEHPGIARIYGAGRDAETGVVYFAMELVDGVPLTRYAAGQERAARIALLAAVCDAVQHAHLNGVIHRDLKPDNILVDQAGRPKVLDFGIARWAEGSGEPVTHTLTGQLVGTPAYMSPEQVARDVRQVDLRADVYALGVLCYEVLAGRPPHDLTQLPLAAALRVVAEAEPPPPSRHVPELRGDLDLICLHALAKDPTRRYGSAAELAADLRRVLANQPIQVRPPSPAYLLARFVRRHRAASFLAVVALLLLVSAVLGTSVGLFRAERERARAVSAAEGVRAINRQLLLLVGQIPPELFSGLDVAQELLRRWEEAIRSGFAEDPALQTEMRELLGWAQYNLGLYADGAENLRQAAAGYAAQQGPAALATLRARDRFVQCRSRVTVDAELLAFARESFVRCREALGFTHGRTLTAMATEASMLHAAGRTEAALERYRDVLPRLAAVDPFGLETLSVRSDYALVLADAGQAEAAEAQYAAVVEAFAGQHPGQYPERELNAMIGLSQLLERRQALPEAVAILERIVATARRRWGEGQVRTLRQANRLARLYLETGARQRGQDLAAETARISKRQAPRSEESLIARNTWIHSLLREGAHDRAEAEARALLADMQGFLPATDPRVWTARDDLANALAGLGRHAEAEQEFRAVLELREQALGPRATSTLISMNNLAWLLLQAGESTRAAARYGELMARADAAELPERARATFRLNHGRALLAAGQLTAAEQALTQALAAFRKLPGTAELERKATAALGELAQRQGR